MSARKRRKIPLSATQWIMCSFLLVILLGSVLLVLPISVADGAKVSYIDALFTATSATCVTGLVTVTTATTWSVFGQIVILALIQVGGLGIITVTTGLALLLHRKMRLKDSQLLQEAFNLNSLSGLKKFLKKVICGTLLVEAVGAILYMPVFIPNFGVKGVWISVFNSISAFCNAGIDLVGDASLCAYATNPLSNVTTCLLIVLGGIGYIVWWDVFRVLKEVKIYKWKSFQRLTFHSKIALTATSVLIFSGAIAVFSLEYNNPLTLQAYGLFDKIQLAFFQSVTTRTAGFATLPQENFTNATALVCLLLMFIGGSPVGTAGGVKTVTIVVLMATAFANITNKNETSVFGRNIPKQAVGKAVAVTAFSFVVLFVSCVALSAAMPTATGLDILYEAVSATATVGLTRGFTPLINLWGKWILIVTMYLGRVGPISLAIVFMVRKKSNNIIKNPTEEISIG